MKLLLIADDFTGALDAGVQFAKRGFRTRVLVYSQDSMAGHGDVDVLAVDAETRHKTPGDAYRTVYALTEAALGAGVSYVFKKTDSALRGNIGAELTAVLDAAGGSLLSFVPALPGMNRVTVGGIHSIDGVPVEKSVFGADPFEPVPTSDVAALIRLQSEVAVRVIPEGQALADTGEKTIAVYDCTSDEGMARIAGGLKGSGNPCLMAGCAGFAGMVPELLGGHGSPQGMPPLPGKFLVVCGSVNPITVRQLDYAQRQGFVRFCLAPGQKLEKGFCSTGDGEEFLDRLFLACSRDVPVILDTNDPAGSDATVQYARERGLTLDGVRTRIAATLGTMVEKLVDRGLASTILMTGGDTLLGYIQRLEGAMLTPVGELERGIVLSELNANGHRMYVITKSGGFGEETLLTDLAEKLCRENGKI